MCLRFRYASLLLATMLAGCGGGSDVATVPATVTPANSAPTISGSPATTVIAGQSYVFAPIASDADGNVLGFSIISKPIWATFSTATGALTGTPTAGQAGAYGNIVISVSDGQSSATLPAFAITVTAPPTGSVTLLWSIPALNEDGSDLTDLAGYRIAYGVSPNMLIQTLDIPDSSATTHVIDDLADGTWYFTIRSYTTAGIESQPSNAASKTL